MAGLKELAASRGNLLNIEWDKLTVEEDFNVRTDYGDIQELAEDIAIHGVRRPLRVRLSEDGESAVIVDGHRRHRAAGVAINELGASVPPLPCIPETRGTNEESRIIDMLVENGGQKPLTAVEEGEAYRRLLAMGWSKEKLVQETGKKIGYINDRLDLNAAPRDVRDAVSSGTMTARTAKQVAKASPEARAAILEAKPKGEGKKGKITGQDVSKGLGKKVRMTSPTELKSLIEELKAMQEEIDPSDLSDTPARLEGMIAGIRIVLGDMTLKQTLAQWKQMLKGSAVA